MAERLEQREKQKQILQQEIGKEKILNRIPTEHEVNLFFESFVRGDINDRMFRRELIDILVNSVYLEDKDDGIQKMTVLLNVQNGLETVRLNDVKGCSSNRRMVGQAETGHPRPKKQPTGLFFPRPAARRPGRAFKSCVAFLFLKKIPAFWREFL